MASNTRNLNSQPVTTWQKFLLDQDADPECTDDLRSRWILVHATRVRPSVDLRRLRRALEKLRQRHDSLCIRFERAKGKWRAVFDPPGPIELKQIDLRDLDDASFHAELMKIAYAPMPLVGHPLAEMVLVHGGEQGDVIVSRVHQAITDGYGMVVLTEDLTKFLIGMPILAPAITHARYLAKFQSPPANRAAEIEAFWREMHSDIPISPKIGRNAGQSEARRNLTGLRDSRILKLKAKPDDAAAAIARVAAQGSHMTTSMFAGYAEALCQNYDIDDLLFGMPVARTNPALDTYAGHHTLVPIIRYRAAGSAGMTHAIRSLSKTMLNVIAHLPADAARRGTDWQDALFDQGANLTQFTANQPRAMGRQQRSVFSRGFNTDPDVEHTLGPYRLSTIELSLDQRALADVRFQPVPIPNSVDFDLIYDGKCFGDDEMRQLAVRICSLLEIEPGSIELP